MTAKKRWSIKIFSVHFIIKKNTDSRKDEYETCDVCCQEKIVGSFTPIWCREEKDQVHTGKCNNPPDVLWFLKHLPCDALKRPTVNFLGYEPNEAWPEINKKLTMRKGMNIGG